MGSDANKPEGNNETPPPEALAAGAPASMPTLPVIAAKADDLEEIKKAVEDAASVSGGLWLSYLFVLSYIAIAAGAVTHEDLLLVRPVKLPFLNVELPLKAFFALAPFVVLIIHAYALMHFIMLGKKASRFHNALYSQYPDRGTAPDGTNKDIRDKKRWLLPSNIFVQTLAGPPELRGGFFGIMLKVIALTTLVLLPVLVLLLLQIQFLPFHDTRITWAQRGALFLDVLLLWPLRPPILADLGTKVSQRAQSFSWNLRRSGLAVAFVLSVTVIWFAFFVATVPGEWRSFPLHYVAKLELKTVTDTVFGTVDAEGGKIAGNWPSNTLRLKGFDIYEALKVDDPKKLDWKDYIFDLHSRRLEGAVFIDAKLGKVYFREAHLEGALVAGAQLQGAALDGAQLQGASLVWAQLQGASLKRTELQGASLEAAQLQGASLIFSQLQGASLRGARLEGASLDGAWLEGASLDGAQLQGAKLIFSQLQGASLFAAQLQGASLGGAQLQGASLERAHLQGASLSNAQLQGASLEEAHLQGASLDHAHLQGASLDQAEVNATGFSNALLWRTHRGDLAELGTVRLKDAIWKPILGSPPLPWDAKAYEGLRNSMNTIPAGEMRDNALKRIERLGCGNPDKTLASCDPAATPPPEVLDWQEKLKAASANDAAFAKALATELRSLVCANDTDADHILRGVISNGQLFATGREAPALVDFIMSKDCPVSASLTEDDKARLLKIKQDAEKNFPPPLAKQDK